MNRQVHNQVSLFLVILNIYVWSDFNLGKYVFLGSIHPNPHFIFYFFHFSYNEHTTYNIKHKHTTLACENWPF